MANSELRSTTDHNADEPPGSEFYVADKQLADSLLLDCSMLTPAQQEILHDVAATVKEHVAQQYEPYIQAEALNTTSHVADRPIVMKREDFEGFYGQWNRSGDTPSEATFGVTYRHGEIIALMDPNEVWGVCRPDAQEAWVEQFGSEDVARQLVGDTSILDNLTHEVTHQFQDNSLPDTFLEIGTRYYQRQTASELKLGYLDNPSIDASIKLYEQALQTYGTAVHEVYFGKPIPPDMRNEIVSTIMREAGNYPSLGDL
jgi:hypothetical protein